jgi:hypothetical protein
VFLWPSFVTRVDPRSECSGGATHDTAKGVDRRQLKKIVVGHDFQSGGDIAARCTAELAMRRDAHVKFVHVIDLIPLSQRWSSPLTLARAHTERRDVKLSADIRPKRLHAPSDEGPRSVSALHSFTSPHLS